MPNHRHHTTYTRDAALGQLRRINRWLIAGSIALTGALSAVAAHAFPGKTIETAPADAAGTGASKASKQPSGAASSTKTSTQSLQPPTQAPKSSTPSSTQSQQSGTSQESSSGESTTEASSPVVSGGS
jgi:hypothetical protein